MNEVAISIKSDLDISNTCAGTNYDIKIAVLISCVTHLKILQCGYQIQSHERLHEITLI